MNETNSGAPAVQDKSLRDYLNIIRNNLSASVLITICCLIVAVFYAVNSKDIFRAQTLLKVSKPQGSILESPLLAEFQDLGGDRFIANEIEILKSYTIRERVAKALIDSAVNYDIDSFFLIVNKDSETEEDYQSIIKILETLEDAVSVEQRRGLDIIEISVESASAFEAALIADLYAQQYRNLNLEINRNQLSVVKDFLLNQKNEKLQRLNEAEDILRTFQEKGGVVALDIQASSLISQLSSFEAQRNAAQIELSASNKVLQSLKNELEMQNPRLADYLESFASEAYFKSLQEQLAKLELNRDLAKVNNDHRASNAELINVYNSKIEELKGKLKNKIEVIKAGIFASSPGEVKELSKKIIEEEVKNQSLQITLTELQKLVDKYDIHFNKLPGTSIELARYQRNRESLEKLYVLVEEKYQEALINEQSQPGNVFIIDSARRPDESHKPNRYLIMLVGLILGSSMAVGFVLIKNYFDTTIKSPEDIKKKNINLLGWIPQISGAGLNGESDLEFIVSKKPESIPSEAFRALRTRARYSKVKSGSLKTLLVTSPAAQEGKTTVSINLAGVFAQSKARTLIIDCDLRKPRIHSIFKADKTPGVVDYLLGYASLEEIIRPSSEENLKFISSGTIPTNPAEILESPEMEEFLKQVRKMFDVIILDSAPVIPVADSEILAKRVDGSILVVSADTTETEIMLKSAELLQNEASSFLGTVLNNFSQKSGYGGYYKYYYYYTSPGNGKEKNQIT